MYGDVQFPKGTPDAPWSDSQAAMHAALSQFLQQPKPGATISGTGPTTQPVASAPVTGSFNGPPRTAAPVRGYGGFSSEQTTGGTAAASVNPMYHPGGIMGILARMNPRLGAILRALMNQHDTSTSGRI